MDEWMDNGVDGCVVYVVGVMLCRKGFGKKPNAVSE